ncbi:hypothetical protein [Anaerosolibacter sp.]|uniref:hypothetical protein n=1 Tax=Anaerosolibacter sp. TaxID=1872527 RepID=UPI0039EE0EB2
MDDNTLKYRVAGNLKTSTTGKYLFTLIYDLSNGQGRIQISIGKLSDILKISESAVRSNLHRLEQKGYILIRKIFESDGTRKANEYIIK